MSSSHTMGMPHTGIRSSEHTKKPYLGLLLASTAHFIIMYAVMYTMVDNFSDVFINLNNVYMTGMMLAPMTLLMILTMGMMYPNKKKNIFIAASCVAIFAAFFVFMRNQTLIGDKEFVRSMIPHHSGAVLMCNEAKIQDAELQNLCAQIVESQIKEIEQMKKILSRL